MHSAWKSVRLCWGQDDAPSPACETVSEKFMNISRGVSEESRFAFRSQADVVNEKSRERTPTRNNRQLSKDSDFRNTRTMSSLTISSAHPSSDYERYTNALNHIRSSDFDPGGEASKDDHQVQAHTAASVQSKNDESRPLSTHSDLKRDTTATGPPEDVASEEIKDTRPSAASPQTKAALNRRKIQKFKSWRSQQIRREK